MEKPNRESRRVLKIVSGGQTGADLGGLLAARDLGIETGGAAPQGWWTEDGPQEELLRSFGLVECDEPGYPARTRWNVLHSDATLLVGPYDSGGSALTDAVAKQAKKPIFHLAYAAKTPSQIKQFQEWLTRHDVRILNVAGSRESSNPGICDFTRDFLFAAL